MSLGYRKGIISAQVDGPTLTAAASATCLPPAMRKTLAANYWDAIEQQLLGEITGRISCAVTTPGTARFDVRLGGTVIFDSLAMNLNIVAKVNVHFSFKFMLTLRAVGAAANFHGWGRFESEAVIGSPLPTVGGSGCLLVPVATAPAVGGNFDSTIAQQLDMNFTQTVATGSLTVHQAIFEAHRWE
jgi:hypothetical protein